MKLFADFPEYFTSESAARDQVTEFDHNQHPNYRKVSHRTEGQRGRSSCSLVRSDIKITDIIEGQIVLPDGAPDIGLSPFEYAHGGAGYQLGEASIALLDEVEKQSDGTIKYKINGENRQAKDNEDLARQLLSSIWIIKLDK